MLVKATNQCAAGCVHCFEGSRAKSGEHMAWSTFTKTLAFTRRVERQAWAAGCPPLFLLSGGECTEHPMIVQMVEEVYRQGMFPVLITNGLWLEDEELRGSLLRPEWPMLLVQVTNDPRYYPRMLKARVQDPRIVYDTLPANIVPLGRAAGRSVNLQGEAWQVGRAPTSFNFRSAGRSLRSFTGAVTALRTRAWSGKSGHCVPSVTHEGWVMAGETRNCWKLGTVESSDEELTEALLAMGSCNRCGLEAGLDDEHKAALGVPGAGST